ncbi:hypothetical protein RYX36_032282 [Vicia faba]
MGKSVAAMVDKHINCGLVESIEVQLQFVAHTPVSYRMEQADSGAANVGYVRLKEFNALAQKDLVIESLPLLDDSLSASDG